MPVTKTKSSMVEVFKTNVEQLKCASRLLKDLAQQFPMFRINFDLDDCDRILRVEGKNILPVEIIELLKCKGYKCHVLD